MSYTCLHTCNTIKIEILLGPHIIRYVCLHQADNIGVPSHCCGTVVVSNADFEHGRPELRMPDPPNKRAWRAQAAAKNQPAKSKLLTILITNKY